MKNPLAICIVYPKSCCTYFGEARDLINTKSLIGLLLVTSEMFIAMWTPVRFQEALKGKLIKQCVRLRVCFHLYYNL